jgi:Ca2+-binding EF-hand superfamily protein
MRVVHLAVLMAAAILPASAFAKIEPSVQAGTLQSGNRAAYARFKALDYDHDGGLTWGELQSRGRQYGADTLFLLLDADGDGRISLKEIAGRNEGARLARFDAYDVDKNGVVTRREFPAFLDRYLFEALDADHDGRLSLAELRPAFAGAPAQRRPPPVQEARHHPAEPPRLPLCWVPMPGRGQVRMVAPVAAGACRTQ